MFGFAGVIRRNIRVAACALTLVADRYPPPPTGLIRAPAEPCRCRVVATAIAVASRSGVYGPDRSSQLIPGLPGGSRAGPPLLYLDQAGLQ